MISFAARLRAAARRLLRGRPPGSPLAPDAQGQAAGDLIRGRLEGAAPCMIGRLGRIELEALLRCAAEAPWGTRPGDAALQAAILNNAGFFPTDDAHLRRFAARYRQDLPLLDVLGAWLPGEGRVRPLFPAARIVPLPDLEPYYHADPWSRALAGRRVLVVHPFAESIRRQYARRAALFADRGVLPDFELLTLQAVQTIAGNPADFADWFAALDWMGAQMEAQPFDVAIIGAGAYGLPLAAHAKRLGRQAVHLGGATQILFGIKGRRWDHHPVISRLYNPAWVRPQPHEIPANHTAVEGGCYW